MAKMRRHSIIIVESVQISQFIMQLTELLNNVSGNSDFRKDNKKDSNSYMKSLILSYLTYHFQRKPAYNLNVNLYFFC